MKNLVKKNKIVILGLAALFMTAGYLNYSLNTEQVVSSDVIYDEDELAAIGDARLVSGNAVSDESNNGSVSNSNMVLNGNVNSCSNVSSEGNSTSNVISNVNGSGNNTSSDNSLNGNSMQTTASSKSSSEYFSESKLDREKMYSEMLESCQEVIGNSSVAAEQKSSAQQEITRINNERNAIMIAENLISNKGLKNVLIFSNNGSISVVISNEKNSEDGNTESAVIAQIESIVERELGVSAENIHISTYLQN